MVKKWCVVYTKPRNEKRVAERLNNLGYNIYCPMVKTLRQWSDRKKIVRLPMFTSYIFANISEQERRFIIQDPGVLKFVHWDGRPAIVRQAEIDIIKKIELRGSEVEVTGPTLNIGESVEINEGPFKGLNGEVRKVDKSRLSVWIESLKSSLTFTYEVS